ncbi:MAG: anthranilate synthase component I family protein [Acidobacteriota bacterium]|nr:anthranilate synthase component I family protein [Acidobacteriota bacterium]
MAVEILTQLPEPGLLLSPVSPSPLASKCTEEEFLDLALSRLQLGGPGCFLDSAGPCHERSRRSFLSGVIRGLFLEENGRLRFEDLQAGASYQLTREEFAGWVDAFAHLGERLAGPMLFPLLTYESFNPAGFAPRPHPLWPGIQAAWLLSEDSVVYDRETETLIQSGQDFEPVAWSAPACRPRQTGWRESEREYSDKIALVQRDITDGIYYQANLSQRFACAGDEDPFRVYRRLRALNPSPFMGMFRLGDHMVISGSPERLVEKRDNFLSSRPIAGTRPRFQDNVLDARSKMELCASEKERAEHLMLVDLIRNDLGRIAATGSVRVDEFLTIETYSHVHHLVSEVSARLAEGISLFDLIASMFPGGTITGAPKISCMKRLRELEGEARGPYTGSMGYVTTGGEMDLNILIRTLIYHAGYYCLHAGGGIVADSVHHAEFKEARYKGAALMEALGIQDPVSAEKA